jgi:hypothetical protein
MTALREDEVMRTIVAVMMGGALLAGCANNAPRLGYAITPNEMLEVYGSYALSNGDTLRISREHRRYWAESTQAGRVEIVPVDSIVFVEKNGPRRYTFTPLPFTTELRITSSSATYAALSGSSSRSGIEREFGE